ncbi:MAG: hypothetical protein HPY61_08475 [Methanotrichaceae archaeon]|nr:hypothetical protein [Methanotrichaceae archaeon]
MIYSEKLISLLRPDPIKVVSRLMGLILTIIAVQMMIVGIMGLRFFVANVRLCIAQIISLMYEQRVFLLVQSKLAPRCGDRAAPAKAGAAPEDR